MISLSEVLKDIAIGAMVITIVGLVFMLAVLTYMTVQRSGGQQPAERMMFPLAIPPPNDIIFQAAYGTTTTEEEEEKEKEERNESF
jgi:hypothetical protein